MTVTKFCSVVHTTSSLELTVYSPLYVVVLRIILSVFNSCIVLSPFATQDHGQNDLVREHITRDGLSAFCLPRRLPLMRVEEQVLPVWHSDMAVLGDGDLFAPSM
jgi:hypothetical protein